MLLYSLEAMREAKEAGKIRAIGNSGHRVPFMRKTMGEWDGWDVIMFPYNYAHSLAQRYVLPTAKAHDVGVVAMKPFAAGRVFRVDPQAGFRDAHVLPQDQQSVIATAMLKWILQNEMIHTIVPGMNTPQHVDIAVAASGAELTHEERVLLEDLALRTPLYGACYSHA